MPTYFCHACAALRGLIRTPPSDLITTEYQLEKYIKHTVPDARYPIASLFDDTSTGTYRDYVVAAASEGSVEIDHGGRTNIVWAARRPTGLAQGPGASPCICTGIGVVLTSDTGEIHAFPDEASRFQSARCSGCGGSIVR